MFEVTDTGVGVVSGDREHIFEAFWQVDQSLTRMTRGSGLGLSVASGLARLLGGDVTLVRSEVGKGSTFAASLPIDGPTESPLTTVPPHSPA